MKEIEATALHLVAGGDEITENLTLAGAIGAGAGASHIINKAGGLASVSESLALAVGAARLSGIAASAYAGWKIGKAIYENSETVRNGAEKVIEFADKWISTYPNFNATFGIGGWGTKAAEATK